MGYDEWEQWQRTAEAQRDVIEVDEIGERQVQRAKVSAADLGPVLGAAPADGRRSLRGTWEVGDQRVYGAFAASPPTEKNPDGSIINHVGNAIVVLENDPRWADHLAYDVLSREVVMRYHPADPFAPPAGRLDVEVATWIVHVYGLPFRVGDCAHAVADVAMRTRVDPIGDYLRALEWDGVPRLQTWLHDYLGAPDDRLRAMYGERWMVGAARRALSPGAQNDHVLVLQGPQGAGKTTTTRILSRAGVRTPPRAMRAMPSDVRNKDALVAAGSAWIVEIGELDAMRKSERTAVKDYLTQTHDTFRPPYAAAEVTVPRACAFIGTTNDSDFLQDPTGSRRFWVVPMTKLKAAELEAVADQLWAEAVYLVGQGVSGVLPEAIDRMRDAEASDYEDVHPWEEAIAVWLSAQVGVTPTAAEVMSGALELPPQRQEAYHVSRVGTIMKRLGWVSRQVRDRGGARVRRYYKAEGV